MTPSYITIHNTANDASAANEITYMLNNNDYTSYHVAVDDKEVIQAIPFNRNAWHAGDGNGTGNRNTIGIEICYSKSGGTRFTEAEKNAAEYTAKLLNERGWGIDRVKRHYDWSGKYCPHRTMDLGWDRFLNMVQTNLTALQTPKKEETVVVKDLEKGKDNSIYRLYCKTNGDHLLTEDYNEANKLQKQSNWNYEGVSWIAPTKGEKVYRVYNPNSGLHHYCLEEEKAGLIKAGWKLDGVAFFAGETNPIYRAYNPNGGQHMFTPSKEEKDTLVKAGWKDEGIAFKY
jgi:N-acetylmuramoyl-L-alanine amidase CwlA